MLQIYNKIQVPSLKLTAKATWKSMVGSDEIPFGARPIFRDFAVSFRAGCVVCDSYTLLRFAPKRVGKRKNPTKWVVKNGDESHGSPNSGKKKMTNETSRKAW